MHLILYLVLYLKDILLIVYKCFGMHLPLQHRTQVLQLMPLHFPTHLISVLNPFFYRLLIVRNKTAQIFSTFKVAYFTCKEMPRTCIRIFRYKSLAYVTINTFSFQKFFGFVCQTGNTNILLSLILVLHFADVLPARCASVSNPVFVINQLHAQNLFLL